MKKKKPKAKPRVEVKRPPVQRKPPALATSRGIDRKLFTLCILVNQYASHGQHFDWNKAHAILNDHEITAWMSRMRTIQMEG